MHEEYRDYSNTNENTEWVTITMDTWDDPAKQQTLTVPKGTQMYIVGNIKPKTNANKIVFTQSSGQEDLELIRNNPDADQLPFDIAFTADRTKTIALYRGDNYVMGGRDGFRLSDTYGNKNQDRQDTDFSKEFRLSSENDWEKLFPDLPLIEEQDLDPKTGAQTIRVYSYYLEETECSPSDFYPIFTGSGVTLGNIGNRIGTDSDIVAENIKASVDVTIRKVDKDDVDSENPVTLPGAVFTIVKYKTIEFREKDMDWEDDGEKVITDVNSTGIYSVTGLPAGFYKIIETECPDGYVKLSEDPIFEVRFNAEMKKLEVILLNPDKTDAEDNRTTMVRVDLTDMIIGNEPGAALPNTGGPGTTLIYLFGLLLAGIGGIGFLTRGRKTGK